MGDIQTLIIYVFIVVAIFSVVYTTLKSIASGVKDGIKNGKDIINGTPYEEIQKRNEEIMREREEEELKKMESTAYRLTHPLEYLNCIIIKKLRERDQ